MPARANLSDEVTEDGQKESGEETSEEGQVVELFDFRGFEWELLSVGSGSLFLEWP
jgi:hypothetical protein